MTIRFASLANDPSVLPQPVLVERRRKSEMQSNIQVPVGEAPGDTDIFGRIPSSCKIDPGSKVYWGALTGITSYDLGLYAEGTPWVIDATKGSANCLIAAKDVHLAGNSDMTAAITPDKGGKFAWEIAGLASDPGGFLLVVGTVHAAGGTSTAAQWIDLHLNYRTS